ncbi:endonuclease/exonuclease/phosphatase family protein [Nocardia puris]|uniref:Exodeoxyribonuclease-3 n=1 Tax=Nocardia puris TaxID=208602 RepID=A0A366DQ04_9NOCA|nr:endonuclease/exonuclease/phosphatase family protein [Nocardia puris]RBO91354.1 exodeoxyribonuclease-3 [Nocardia puris]
MTLSLLTLNIQNPSPQRAERQIHWLAGRDDDVIVLTETKGSTGCRLIADTFTAAGFDVHYPVPDAGDYGVMVISRLPTNASDFGDRIGYLPARALGVVIETSHGRIEIIGAYVPSRDASAEKTARKRKWLHACLTGLTTRSGPTAFIGDLNVLEPDHDPRYRFFADFEYDFYRRITTDGGLDDAFRALHPDLTEYSWVGRTGDGYRYDHLHMSRDLTATLLECNYLHAPRLDRLTDHSALAARLAVEPAARLVTSDPAAAGEPHTLF